jgi:hypothetical protein
MGCSPDVARARHRALRRSARARRSVLRLLAVCAFLSFAACDDAASEPSSDAGEAEDADAPDASAPLPEPGPLVNNALWQVLNPAEDPFMESPMPLCPPLSSGDESLGGELVYAVRTERCPSLTARQASRREVLPGDSVTIRAYHFPLTAPENATARLIVQLGEREIFRRELPIPSEASELSETFVADEGFARGTPVFFHVENHGANEYVLICVDVSR